MPYILASDPLAAWGQAAAIILLFYMFLSVLIGLGVALGLMLGLTWVREKVELIKKLRPTVDSINTTSLAASKGQLPPAASGVNKIARTVAEVPAYAHTIEEKVDQGSQRVADTVIEFRARTEMAKTVLKALFLPGLTKRPPSGLLEEGVGFRSPGYRMLVDERSSGEEAATGPGSGYIGTISASQMKDAPVEVVTAAPTETQSINTETKHVPAR